MRDTFVAGIFAAVPLVFTFVIIWWLDKNTSVLAAWIPFGGSPEEGDKPRIPLLGIVVALLGIYLLGLAVRSFMGKYTLSVVDRFLLRMPVVKPVYEAWKQVSLTPGGKGGTLSRVVLVPFVPGSLHLIGFTSGEAVPGSVDICCVLVPNAPNPISGRLYFVPRTKLQFLTMSAEEALKVIVSTGNYIPEEVGRAIEARQVGGA